MSGKTDNYGSKYKVHPFPLTVLPNEIAPAYPPRITWSVFLFYSCVNGKSEP